MLEYICRFQEIKRIFILSEKIFHTSLVINEMCFAIYFAQYFSSHLS